MMATLAFNELNLPEIQVAIRKEFPLMVISLRLIEVRFEKECSRTNVITFQHSGSQQRKSQPQKRAKKEVENAGQPNKYKKWSTYMDGNGTCCLAF